MMLAPWRRAKSEPRRAPREDGEHRRRERRCLAATAAGARPRRRPSSAAAASSSSAASSCSSAAPRAAAPAGPAGECRARAIGAREHRDARTERGAGGGGAPTLSAGEAADARNGLAGRSMARPTPEEGRLRRACPCPARGHNFFVARPRRRPLPQARCRARRRHRSRRGRRPRRSARSSRGRAPVPRTTERNVGERYCRGHRSAQQRFSCHSGRASMLPVTRACAACNVCPASGDAHLPHRPRNRPPHRPRHADRRRPRPRRRAAPARVKDRVPRHRRPQALLGVQIGLLLRRGCQRAAWAGHEAARHVVSAPPRPRRRRRRRRRAPPTTRFCLPRRVAQAASTLSSARRAATGSRPPRTSSRPCAAGASSAAAASTGGWPRRAAGWRRWRG